MGVVHLTQLPADSFRRSISGEKEILRLRNLRLTRLTKTVYGFEKASVCFGVTKTRLTAKTCPAGLASVTARATPIPIAEATANYPVGRRSQGMGVAIIGGYNPYSNREIALLM
jgi:hypothetical protein